MVLVIYEALTIEEGLGQNYREALRIADAWHQLDPGPWTPLPRQTTTPRHQLDQLAREKYGLQHHCSVRQCERGGRTSDISC